MTYKFSEAELQELKEKEELTVKRVKKARMLLADTHPFYCQVVSQMDFSTNYTFNYSACVYVQGSRYACSWNPEFVTGIGPVRRKAVIERINESLKAGRIQQEEADKQIKDLDRWWREKNNDEMTFIMAHETEHLSHSHLDRILPEDNKELANKAADFAINARLCIELFGNVEEAKRKAPIVAKGCVDEKYIGWTYRQIYKDLMEQQKKGDGEGQGQTIDQHGDAQTGGSSLMDHMGISNPVPKGTAQEQAEAQDKFEENIKAAARANADKCPSHLAERYLTVKEHVVDWKNVLRKTVRGLVKTESSYQRPSRRSWALTNYLHGKNALSVDRKVILPGYVPQPEIELSVGVDSSGSLGDAMLSAILSEVVGVVKTFKGGATLNIFEWNTEASNGATYTHKDLREIKAWRPKTSGGTSIRCCEEYVKEHYSKTKMVIIATDGEFFDDPCPQFGKEYEVVWLILDNKNVKPETGKVIYINT